MNVVSNTVILQLFAECNLGFLHCLKTVAKEFTKFNLLQQFKNIVTSINLILLRNLKIQD